jgi:hypothetical protein
MMFMSMPMSMPMSTPMSASGGPILSVVLLLAALLAADALAARGGGGGGRSGARGSGHAGHHSGGAAARPANSGAHAGHLPHFRTGAIIGAPLFAPLYYGLLPPYLPYATPAVPAAPAAPIYIEQYPGGPPEALPVFEAPSRWYYCAGSNAYYPYVQECAEDWQLVAPQPSPKETRGGPALP